MASTSDGPRYVASLQDVTDVCCYKDFFEGEVFEETKIKADGAAEKHQRSSLVYDRKSMAITYKKVIAKVKKEELPKKVEKNGKKPKVKKKVITKDDYFD